MKLPSVSIVTPSFNQAAFLERTIRSVLDQGYPDLEYVILDGGSTDGSAEIIQRYADRLAYWRSAPDDGQAAAINEGWARTSGEVVAWLNSDDFYMPGALQAACDRFGAEPSLGILYGRCKIVDAAGRDRGEIGEPFDIRRLAGGHQMIPQPSSFFRRSLLAQIGTLDGNLRWAMDFDLYLRAADKTTPIYTPEVLAAFTVHPGSKTASDRRNSRRETFEVALRRAHGADRIRVRALAARAEVFHSLPSGLRAAIDARRRSPVNFEV